MKISRQFFLSLLALTMTAAMATGSLAYKREELRKYKEKNLTAPDFSLKDYNGKPYSLKDYRDKKWVILETGSST